MPWYEDKEYQEMCEGTEELQKKAKRELRKNPPKTLIGLDNSKIDIDNYSRFWKGDIHGGYAVKIFSQEDLQEIYCKEKKCAWVDFLLDFSWWLYKSRKETITKAYMMQALAKKWNSETQLKLAFVMHELYRKNWNPEKKIWEKEV